MLNDADCILLDRPDVVGRVMQLLQAYTQAQILRCILLQELLNGVKLLPCMCATSSEHFDHMDRGLLTWRMTHTGKLELV